MIEFDVDMRYLEEAGELDYVILHDENGEMDDIRFVPESEDFLREIYDWAYYRVEGCDEPEWTLYNRIISAITTYLLARN